MQHSAVQQANLDLVARSARAIFPDATVGHDDFADDFVFHFFNPQLPDLAGDHHGLDGTHAFFVELGSQSEAGFHNHPHSLTPFGDELVVAYVTNTLGIGGATIEVDAIVVWRVVGGRITEAWDIPAVNTVRFGEPEPT